MDVTACDPTDEASEYGSDFTSDEEEVLNGLLQVQSALEITDNPITNPELQYQDAKEDGGGLRCIRISAKSAKERPQVQIHDRNEVSANIESDISRTERGSSASIEAPLDPTPEVPDLRSPLERFRTKPKKALSVTDLISPSWCELQYWYVLTKHGKKRRTPAMRQGSKVHKTLEDEVHVTVQVDIQTKQDQWGLRLWNVIQGLRTLRETGMTRELEIWGLVDGQVVNGVIDQLTYDCPDRELEIAAEEKKKGLGKRATPIAPDQATITEFLNPRATLESAEDSFANALRSSQPKSKVEVPSTRIYISDVKTRGVQSIPKGASFKPTMIQLLLYHRLLAGLAAGEVDSDLLFERYGLDRSLTFTDSFIAQIGNLHQGYSPEELDHDDPSQPDNSHLSSRDSMSILLAHNSLHALWGFMIEEFKSTFPLGAKSLGSVLKAEYRDSISGAIMGSKTILYEPETLEKYLSDEMEWWRGERSARGVPVEEAFKCGSCEFAEGCEWRANKIDDHVKKMRSKSNI